MSNNLPKIKGYSVLKEMSKREYCTTVVVKEGKSGEIKIIKIYKKRKISEEDEERYKCYLEKLRKLIVPNICKVENVIVNGSIMLITMSEYANCLENINPVEYFKESGVEEILKAICECISVFHANSLIYENLKPSNIFISEENSLYFSDYFCNMLSPIKMMGINEISYLSPEMIKSDEISEKNDIWSIGCLIYYLMSGKRIFDGEATNEIKIKILKGKFKVLDCEFNKLLNPLINKLLKINPKERISINKLKKEIIKIQSNIYLPVITCNSKYYETKEKGNEYYERKDYFKAIQCYNECFKYISNDEERCEIHRFIGESFYYLDEYAEAIKSLQKALNYSSEVNVNIKCETYDFVGRSYYYLAEYAKAIKSLQNSLKYSSEVENCIKCEIHDFIGKCYFFLDKYPEALKSLQKSLKYSSEVNNNILCEIHRFLGESNYYLDKYPQGLKSLQEALTYSSKEDDNILCEIHRYTAQCYFYVDEYYQALESFQEALNYSSSEDDNIKCNIHRFIGESYFFLKEYPQALKSFQEALTYSSKVENWIKCEILDFIGKSYYSLKQHTKALKYFRQALKYDDGTYKEEINKFLYDCAEI